MCIFKINLLGFFFLSIVTIIYQSSESSQLKYIENYESNLRFVTVEKTIVLIFTLQI